MTWCNTQGINISTLKIDIIVSVPKQEVRIE
jgi:hypothetical protein